MGTDGGLGDLGAQLPIMDAPLVQMNHESGFQPYNYCKAPIPQVRGRYGDVHTQGGKPSRTYAKPQYRKSPP